ncbi:MAG: hypothetical protein JRH19_25875, partial [Deltaproteobacteria bacterium]|nr:hypothetical protein [Deltaproteobacteria bacterium]
RQWNRGYSQQQTKELKEAYFDLELFDSRLWLRLGKQTIVWGKTELFSFSDQFNPQDFALASLPSLEESRIALWSARGVYSFYNVGPLDDVRIELAFNFDRIQPDDLGACGEAYTPNLVCGLTLGGWAHGITGLGVIGIDRPPSPWESLEGWEIGGRLEFRWDRYSFAIADFYGYDDLPYIDRVTTYERNVDPNSGRPRRYGAYGPCTGLNFDDPSAADPDCLLPGPQTRDADWDLLDPDNNALDNHFANQTIFAMVCSGLPGIAASVDPSACATNIWNSQFDIKREALNINAFTVANLLSSVMSGHRDATNTLWSNSEITFRKKNGIRSPATKHQETGTRGPPLQLTFPPPFVGLSADTQAQPGDNAYGLWPGKPPGDLGPKINQGYWDGNDLSNAGSNCIDNRRIESLGNRAKNPRAPECGGRFWENFPSELVLPVSNNWFDSGLSLKLTPEQEALLGCGPFWGTNCDVSGVDLLNADASVLFQSWPGMEGTGPGKITGTNNEDWRSDDTWVPQPGTIDFRPWANEAHPLRTNLTPVEGREYTSQILGGPRCTTGNLPGAAQDPSRLLPGCRGRQDWGPNGKWEPIEDWVAGDSDDIYDTGFDPKVDGNPGNTEVVSCLDHTDVGAQCFDINEIFHSNDPQRDRYDGYQRRTRDDDLVAQGPFGVHPLTGQHWQNELAALSWNLMVLTIAGDDDFDGSRAYEAGVCGYVTPQHCGNVQGFFSLAGLMNRTVEAGGNGEYGRRTMQWQGGGEIVLRYDKRNVLGFAVDFAEDKTKTNWSLDFTWVDSVPMIDNLSRNNISRHDQYNLTISVDKPTFINFLNPNRTFFMNSQWFISYTQGYHRGLVNNGAWNVLGTLTAQTGYFQDRLLATMTLVYDVMSVSGAGLPQVSYRFNQDFSVTLGLAVWFGRDQLVDMPNNPIGGAASRWGDNAYKDRQSNGISPVRDRDEVFLRLRYTF